SVPMSTPPVEPEDGATRRSERRGLRLLVALLLPLLLGGCDLPNFLGFHGSDSQGHVEHLLWAGTFIAALVVGGIVTVLILWSVVRYRARSDEIPRQFQNQVGLEVVYTIIPVVIVLVLFGFTVVAENKVDATDPPAYQTVDVYAFQWGWEFQYANKGVTVEGETVEDPDPVGLDGARCAPSADCLGPGLVLPVGKNVLIQLRSKDTIHGFYVPEFNFSRYAQPGILNRFEFTATHQGIFRAQCTQFCGLYHSEMFFHVVALPPAQFKAWLSHERSQGSSNSSSSSSSNSGATPSYNGAAA
ncbi:MAG: cytochrome c oxidase subunit II, partial [Acidimicrobiales bacterium]